MLSMDENERLIQTSAGTPMGNLLRRHWMPIAGITEFEECDIRPVTLLGEQLMLFRDRSGTFGLVDRKSAIERSEPSSDLVDARGVRRSYRGWLFGADGGRTDQPRELPAHREAGLDDTRHTKSYPVSLKAGLVWAYLGSDPAPLVPDWEPFSWGNGFVQIAISEVPCNWLQCQEHTVDAVNFGWMPTPNGRRLRVVGPDQRPRQIAASFDEFDHGLVVRRESADTDPVGCAAVPDRVVLWPNSVFLGDRLEWRVPINDERTLNVAWIFSRVPNEREPFVQYEIPAWRAPIADPNTGRLITSHVMNQDFVAWIGQGTIADRTRMQLGESEAGIAILRRRLQQDLEAIEQAREPKGVIRDASYNLRISLPVGDRGLIEQGLPLDVLRRHPVYGEALERFSLLAGQPEAVRYSYCQAMGLPLPATANRR